jgi:CHASE1-domain containing sensor protein
MSAEKNHSAFALLTSRHGALALLAAVVGIALSVAISLLAYSWEMHSIQQNFRSLADDRFHATDSMLRESMQVINFMDNVFLIAPAANSPEFQGYVRSIKKFFVSDLSKNLKVHGLTWAPRVPREERADFERTARELFDPKYQIHAPKDSAKPGVGDQQAESFPCYLSIGNTDLTKRLGEDLSLDPESWKAMQEARDTGEGIAAAPIKMSGRNGVTVGYRIFQPLFVGKSDLKTVEDRRKACAGFMCLDLDIGVFVDNALRDIRPVGIDFLVSDVSDAKPTLVCHHSSRLQLPISDKNAKSNAVVLDDTSPSVFFGRKLLLECHSTQDFWSDRIIWQPWVLLFCGVSLSLVLAGHQFGLALHTSEIERVVSARLAAIQKERAMR